MLKKIISIILALCCLASMVSCMANSNKPSSKNDVSTVSKTASKIELNKSLEYCKTAEEVAKKYPLIIKDESITCPYVFWFPDFIMGKEPLKKYLISAEAEIDDGDTYLDTFNQAFPENPITTDPITTDVEGATNYPSQFKIEISEEKTITDKKITFFMGNTINRVNLDHNAYEEDYEKAAPIFSKNYLTGFSFDHEGKRYFTICVLLNPNQAKEVQVEADLLISNIANSMEKAKDFEYSIPCSINKYSNKRNDLDYYTSPYKDRGIQEFSDEFYVDTSYHEESDEDTIIFDKNNKIEFIKQYVFAALTGRYNTLLKNSDNTKLTDKDLYYSYCYKPAFIINKMNCFEGHKVKMTVIPHPDMSNDTLIKFQCGDATIELSEFDLNDYIDLDTHKVYTVPSFIDDDSSYIDRSVFAVKGSTVLLNGFELKPKDAPQYTDSQLCPEHPSFDEYIIPSKQYFNNVTITVKTPFTQQEVFVRDMMFSVCVAPSTPEADLLTPLIPLYEKAFKTTIHDYTNFEKMKPFLSKTVTKEQFEHFVEDVSGNKIAEDYILKSLKIFPFELDTKAPMGFADANTVYFGIKYKVQYVADFNELKKREGTHHVSMHYEDGEWKFNADALDGLSGFTYII